MRIAVIGGIGVGKSTVSEILKEYEFRTYSADKINASLLETKEYLEEIKKVFPEVFVNGEFDKEKLRYEVFDNKEKLEMLNEISHPMICQSIIDYAKADNVVIEIPLIDKTGLEKYFDVIILVRSAMRYRLKRLAERGLTQDLSKRIISEQPNDRTLKQYATHEIVNNGSIEDIRRRIKILGFLNIK